MESRLDFGTGPMTWHRRIFLLSYRVLDGRPPAQIDAIGYWTTVLSTSVYVALGALILVTLNIGTLLFGVYAEPIWRPNARFRLLKFPNGLPVIPFAVAILLAYASYRAWILRGPFIALGGWFLVAGGALSLIAVMAALNALRRRLQPRSEQSQA
jgi:hypothetical protein